MNQLNYTYLMFESLVHSNLVRLGLNFFGTSYSFKVWCIIFFSGREVLKKLDEIAKSQILFWGVENKQYSN
jgi:hypothetical protein